MRRINTIIAAACAVVATPVLADDEADWNGAYVGVQGGYTHARSATDVSLGGQWSTESASLRNFVATNAGARQRDDDVNIGAQIGYNYQSGDVVLGLEGEFTFLNGGKSETRGPLTAAPSLTYTFTNTVDPKHMFALKGRAGVSLGKTLVYASGGWAWTRATLGLGIRSNGNYLKSGAIDRTLDGFIVGGGVEHKLSDNLSARLSYDYTKQGKEAYSTAYLPGSAFTSPAYTESVQQNLRLHLVRVGVNYRF